MGKYRKTIVGSILEEQEFEKKQQELKQKYQVKDENVLVVEKTNLYKFTMHMIGVIIRTAAAILIFFFAAVGVLALIYPGPRGQMLLLIDQLIAQLHVLLGG